MMQNRDTIISARESIVLRFINQQVRETIELVIKTITKKLEDIEELKDL